MTPAAIAAGVSNSRCWWAGAESNRQSRRRGFYRPLGSPPARPTHDGGDEGTRTPGLRDANAALFQLSYIPTGASPDESGGRPGSVARDNGPSARRSGRCGAGGPRRSTPELSNAPKCRVTLDRLEQPFYYWTSDGPPIRRLRGTRDAPGALGRGRSAAWRRHGARGRGRAGTGADASPAGPAWSPCAEPAGPDPLAPTPTRPGRHAPARDARTGCGRPRRPHGVRRPGRHPRPGRAAASAQRSRCAGTRRRAGRRSRCGPRRRRRRAGRSSRGWISPAPSTPWRPSPAGSARSGSWSWRPWISRRRSPCRVRCSRRGPLTSWCWTCLTAGTRRSPAGGWGTGWAGSRRWRGAPGRCSWSWSPPPSGRSLATAVEEASGLRLELRRTGWIRLGRDVVGQQSTVEVARNRYGPPGHHAELEILYAEGGPRDACLARPDLLAGLAAPAAPPGGCPRRGARSRPPPPILTDLNGPPRSIDTHAPAAPALASPAPAPGESEDGDARRQTAPPARGRTARSSSAVSPGRTGPWWTRIPSPGPSACVGGSRSGAPIGSRPRRPSSTPRLTRTGTRSRPPASGSPPSAPGSPARATSRTRPSGGSPSTSTA